MVKYVASRKDNTHKQHSIRSHLDHRSHFVSLLVVCGTFICPGMLGWFDGVGYTFTTRTEII